MTNPLTRLRAAALDLPEAEERESGGHPSFFVADEEFARFEAGSDSDAIVYVRTSGDDEQTIERPGGGGWVAMSVIEDVDWALVEDRLARSWELAAPQRLLEAGGR